MKLRELSCTRTQVSDLSVLKTMPLIKLGCDFRPERDREILRAVTTLAQINNKSAADFWKEVDALPRKKMP
jgi:hypothetical protein